MPSAPLVPCLNLAFALNQSFAPWGSHAMSSFEPECRNHPAAVCLCLCLLAERWSREAAVERFSIAVPILHRKNSTITISTFHLWSLLLPVMDGL